MFIYLFINYYCLAVLRSMRDRSSKEQIYFSNPSLSDANVQALPSHHNFPKSHLWHIQARVTELPTELWTDLLESAHPHQVTPPPQFAGPSDEAPRLHLVRSGFCYQIAL